MTIPYLMNCDHESDGWCLSCVKQLGEENDRLRAALQPFARCADEFGHAYHSDLWPLYDAMDVDSVKWAGPTVGDCRRAAEVLEGKP